VERLGLQRRVRLSRLTISYAVSYLRLNYKVSFSLSINSLMKKAYNIVYSLCSLHSVEARLGPENLEVHPEQEKKDRFAGCS
jgi:hypothetical protein